MQKIIGFVKARIAAAKAFGANRVKAARILGMTEGAAKAGRYGNAKSWGISAGRLSDITQKMATGQEGTALTGGQISAQDIKKFDEALGITKPRDKKAADLAAVREKRFGWKSPAPKE